MRTSKSVGRAEAVSIRTAVAHRVVDVKLLSWERVDAFGRLVAAGIETADDVRALSSVRIEDRELAGVVDALDSATDAFLLTTSRLPKPEDTELVERLIEGRHRVEMIRLGVETLPLLSPFPSLEASSMASDELVQPFLYRFVAANTLRAELVEALAPSIRHRFSWCVSAMEVAPSSLDHFADVALLVARFEEARAAFSRFVAVEREIVERSQSRHEANHSNVVLLSDLLRERGATRGVDAAPRMAAAEASNLIPLCDTDDFEVSWETPDTIVLDLLCSIDAGSTPELQWSDGSRTTGIGDSRGVDRYRFDVDGRRFTEAVPLLVLRIGGAEIRVAMA